MSFKTLGVYAVALVVVGVAVVGASSATASHIDIEQRRAERAAARAARDAEREARRAARENNEPSCTCAASLGLAKPDVQFRNGVLAFVPRVDVNIRSRGDVEAPDWNAVLDYDGNASFNSSDVSVPADMSFGGTQTIVGGSCGSNFSFKGHALPEVTLAGVLQSLVGLDEELKAKITLHGRLTGCGDEEEVHRQLEVRVQEFGNLRLGSWRSVR